MTYNSVNKGETVLTEINFVPASLGITALWILIRTFFWIKERKISWKRELELLLVYVCVQVIFRITFFPLEKIDGKVAPLVFDAANAFNFRINVIPFVNIMAYDEIKDAIINIIGNSTMFIPVGIVWPAVYKKLDTHAKVVAAGFGFSLLIEMLQLPFFDRVTDIDDFFLNSIGFLAGYGIYLIAKKKKAK